MTLTKLIQQVQQQSQQMYADARDKALWDQGLKTLAILVLLSFAVYTVIAIVQRMK